MEIKTIESRCCGMAGSFGYAKDTAEISKEMAELSLLPAVRDAEENALIVADGTSCRSQIENGTHRQAIHAVQILAMALEQNTAGESM